jgi:uncharacterized protein YihD (DUF1040 family)
MRDEKRIDRILDMLKKVWHKNQDIRFGQLLICSGLSPDTYEFWSIEDDVTEEKLKKILEEKK